MTKREASRGALERLAEAYLEYREKHGVEMSDRGLHLDEMADAYRAEITPPLRSRAEVDAEIAEKVRYYHAMLPVGIGPSPGGLVFDLNKLVAEPTAPEPERCPQCLCVGHHQKPCNPARPPIGTNLSAICPCDEGERLRGYMKDLQQIYDQQGRSWGQVAGLLGRCLGGHP